MSKNSIYAKKCTISPSRRVTRCWVVSLRLVDVLCVPDIYQPSTSILTAGCSQHQLSLPHLRYYSALFQSKSPLPSSSSSMPNPTTWRLSALKGSMY